MVNSPPTGNVHRRPCRTHTPRRQSRRRRPAAHPRTASPGARATPARERVERGHESPSFEKHGPPTAHTWRGPDGRPHAQSGKQPPPPEERPHESRRRLHSLPRSIPRRNVHSHTPGLSGAGWSAHAWERGRRRLASNAAPMKTPPSSSSRRRRRGTRSGGLRGP